VTKLVCHVGTNEELHQAPIMMTYCCRHEEVVPTATTAQTPPVRTQLFEDVNIGSPSSLFIIFFMCLADPTCILLATGTTPPTVAINECIRKSPPCTISVERTTILKWPKTDSAGSRGHTRVSDFDDLTRSLADETISIYQAQITAVQPWPSTAENWESVSQGWVEVCTSRNVHIKLDDEIFKAVRISFRFLFSIFHHSLLYFRLLTVPRKLKVM
jgi:hypothetical protein